MRWFLPELAGARVVAAYPGGSADVEVSRTRIKGFTDTLKDKYGVEIVDSIDALLHVFEEGAYEIPELVRAADTTPEVPVLPSDGESEEHRVIIKGGKVRCKAFPFVVLTSNGERELPPPFLRRCLRLDIPVPKLEDLRSIITAHLKEVDTSQIKDLLEGFVQRQDEGSQLATDQLLNAVFLVIGGQIPAGQGREDILKLVLRELGRG